jgi:hypothetical protein
MGKQHNDKYHKQSRAGFMNHSKRSNAVNVHDHDAGDQGPSGLRA